MTGTDLYVPRDADEAHDAWKANCGPAAFAAILGRTMMSCRQFFPRFPGKPWTNPTHLREALTAAGVPHSTVRDRLTRGLAFIQWEGPWSGNPAKILEAYRHTHWVAVDSGMVYDVNADGWLRRADWEWYVVPRFLEYDARYTGWSVRTRIEVPA